MPRSKPPYPAEFRARVVELAQSGRTYRSLAEEFGVTNTTIRNWVRQADLDQGRRTDGLTSEEKQELSQLRRENARLREERDILKNYRARRHLLLDEKPLEATLTRPERSGRQLFGAVEPDKKHGPGVAADLRVVTPFGDPV